MSLSSSRNRLAGLDGFWVLHLSKIVQSKMAALSLSTWFPLFFGDMLVFLMQVPHTSAEWCLIGPGALPLSCPLGVDS